MSEPIERIEAGSMVADTRRRIWPLVAAVCLLLAAVGALVLVSLRQNGGTFVYALDDAYIHMAVAKNLSTHGVWGITEHEFAGATSSLLWPLLLTAVYAVTGVGTLAPLIMNVVLATLTLVLAFRYLERRMTATSAFTVLLGIIVLSPLPNAIVSGLEHVLHLDCLMLLLFVGTDVLSAADGAARPRRRAVMLCALAAASVMTRYESLGVVALLAVLLALRGRRLLALGVVAASAAPLGIYALCARAHGWAAVPHSILLKTKPFAFGSVVQLFASVFGISPGGRLDSPHTYLFVAAGVIFFVVRAQRGAGVWERGQTLLILVIGAALGHFVFGDTGWFYRYEAYVMGLSVLVIGSAAIEVSPRLRDAPVAVRGAVFLGAAVFLLPALARAVKAIPHSFQAMHDRYNEHITTARFLARYYETSSLAVCDIGTPSFFTHARIFDIYGLGSKEPLLLRRQNRYSPEAVAGIAEARGVEIAIVKPEWGGCQPFIPSGWVPVAEWRMPRNVVFDDRTVRFLAPTKAEASLLRQRLRAFRGELPSEVGYKELGADAAP